MTSPETGRRGRTLDARRTAELLPWGDLADEVEVVLRLRRRGAARAPERLHLDLSAGGTLLAMPATDGEIAVTKLVTTHPENPRRGLPAVRGELIVVDAADGTPLLRADAATVTARRTAAVSLLAARTLAPDPAAPLLLIGAGVQGRAHLEAFRAGLGTRAVDIVSRTRESARSLAAHAAHLGLDARVLDSPPSSAGEPRLVVAATPATEPVVPAELGEGSFVAAVGAYRPDVAEVPVSLLRRATVVVDDRDGARAEAGDLIQAVAAGALSWDEVVSLGDLVAGESVPTGPGPGRGPIVFKSVGHALWDLAAARLLVRAARAG